MKKIILISLLMAFSPLSLASFKTSGECNSCSSSESTSRAKLYKQANDEGIVYIFDFGYNRLNKYRVKSFLNPRSGLQTVIVNTLSATGAELNLFNDMLTIDGAKVNVYVPPNSGYPSGYDMSGCRACQTDVGLWIINNHTFTMMVEETAAQATELFDFINWDYDYIVTVTFSDGVTMELKMVNNELKMIDGTLRDINFNEIPDSTSGVSGSTFNFPPGTSVGSSMVQDLMNRIRDFGWDMGTGSYTCSYQCTPSKCTLSCSGN